MKAEERVIQNAARYLGVRGRPRGEALHLLEAAYPLMKAQAAPRRLLKRAGVSISKGSLVLDAALTIPSVDLCRLFRGAAEGLLLVFTLGAPLDTAVRRFMVTDPALGTAVSACASAYVDECIDLLLEEQNALLSFSGLRLSPRFSPGYGDAPLACQGPLLEWLEAWRIGVGLTDGNLMLPEKSVTALTAIIPKE